MTRLMLASVTALVCVLASAQTAPADEVPVGLLDRIGRLPSDLIKAKKTDGEIVDALYLAALARLPTDAEKERMTKHIATAKDRKTAALDLAWALVNTREFLKVHGLDKNIAQTLEALNKATENWGKDERKDEKK